MYISLCIAPNVKNLLSLSSESFGAVASCWIGTFTLIPSFPIAFSDQISFGLRAVSSTAVVSQSFRHRLGSASARRIRTHNLDNLVLLARARARASPTCNNPHNPSCGFCFFGYYCGLRSAFCVLQLRQIVPRLIPFKNICATQ
jgi:hypothetical protein